MTQIGASWLKHKEDGEFYYSINIDEELLPLTITKDKRLIMKENKNKGSNEKAPDFRVEMYIPKPKEEQ